MCSWKKNKKEKPLLDEQQIMEINVTLKYALQEDLPVRIPYFHKHDEYTIEGKMLNADIMNVFFVMDNDAMIRVQFDDVLNVEAI